MAALSPDRGNGPFSGKSEGESYRLRQVRQNGLIERKKAN